MKRKINKTVPVFTNEKVEQEFWAKNDVTDYFEFDNQRKTAFPNLKYSTEAISIRLPKSLLDDVKSIANKKDVPYQSLIKMYLADRVSEEKKKY